MSSAFALTAEEIEQLIAVFTERSVKRRGIILHQVDICQYFAFVILGCFKMYTIHSNSKEFNLEFATENEWVSDLNSFYDEKPINVYIEAI